jgi:hypothetical protein
MPCEDLHTFVNEQLEDFVTVTGRAVELTRSIPWTSNGDRAVDHDRTIASTGNNDRGGSRAMGTDDRTLLWADLV